MIKLLNLCSLLFFLGQHVLKFYKLLLLIFICKLTCWDMVTALSTFFVWLINWLKAFLFSLLESSVLLILSSNSESLFTAPDQYLFFYFCLTFYFYHNDHLVLLTTYGRLHSHSLISFLKNCLLLLFHFHLSIKNIEGKAFKLTNNLEILLNLHQLFKDSSVGRILLPKTLL